MKTKRDVGNVCNFLCRLVVYLSVIVSGGGGVCAQGVSLGFPNENIAVLAMAGKYAEAEAELLKLEQEPRPFLLAWLKLRQGNKQEGLALLEKSISEAQESDRFSTIFYAIGIIGDAGFLAEAEQWKSRYAKDIESDDSLLAKRVQLDQFLRDKDVRSAKNLIDRMLVASYQANESEMARTIIFRYIIHLYSSAGFNDREAALMYLDKLMLKFPETQIDPAYQMQKSNILSTMKNSLESLKILDRIQSDYPDYYEANKPRFFLNRGYNYEDIGDYERAKQVQLEGRALCEANPTRWQALLMPFDSSLQKHADRELIKEAQEKARREAMGEDYDLDEIIAQRPPRNYALIVLVNVVLIAIIIYLIWRIKNR